jgi:hypothetical protein
MTDHEFCGYDFRGSPPRDQPRLWFLDHQLYPLMVHGHMLVMEGDDSEICDRARWATEDNPGVIEEELRAHAVARPDLHIGRWSVSIPPDTLLKEFPSDQAREVIQMALPGVTVRYERWGATPWSAVWRITDTTIPHVHNFGRDDDAWRLAVWPD